MSDKGLIYKVDYLGKEEFMKLTDGQFTPNAAAMLYDYYSGLPEEVCIEEIMSNWSEYMSIMELREVCGEMVKCQNSEHHDITFFKKLENITTVMPIIQERGEITWLVNM